MDIMTMNFKQLNGISETSDNTNEEYIYKVGSDGKMPVVLFALSLLNYQNVLERYLNLAVHTNQAQESAKEFVAKNSDFSTMIENTVNQFEGMRNPHTGSNFDDFLKADGTYDEVTDKAQKRVNAEFPDTEWQKMNPPKEALLPLGIYASQLSTFLAMRTPNYNFGSEGSPQTCSMLYINFWNRPAFRQAYESVELAYREVVSELIRVMEIRGINVNKEDMTIDVPEYRSIDIKERMYPGF